MDTTAVSSVIPVCETSASGGAFRARRSQPREIRDGLANGRRGLRGGSQSARSPAARRAVKVRPSPRPLEENQILAWADSHRKRTGEWPTRKSGPIADAPDQNWRTVNFALRNGSRGLAGRSSLARLLARERGVRNLRNLPPFSVDEIVRWADCHHARQGRWPTFCSGPIPEAPGETWQKVQDSLKFGRRGLPGRSSLARVLVAERGARKIRYLPPLSADLILAWADAHYARTGQWPNNRSGLIPEAPGETWQKIHNALYFGHRGILVCTTLTRLLNEHRGVPHRRQRSRLSLRRILAWADAFHARSGRWPTIEGGPIPESPGERWSTVATALQRGSRGLPHGFALGRLLAVLRGAE